MKAHPFISYKKNAVTARQNDPFIRDSYNSQLSM